MDGDFCKVMKVLDNEGVPKHNKFWGLNVTIDVSGLKIGKCAVMFYIVDNNPNKVRYIQTSTVKGLNIDGDNIVILTYNSVYHLKKYELWVE